MYGPDLMLAISGLSASGGSGISFTAAAKVWQNGCPRGSGGNSPACKSSAPIARPSGRSLRKKTTRVVEMINQSGADIVWVGLSTPKQGRWRAAHLGKIEAPVMIGVGAAFDIHAGLVLQAPRRMQRFGLEWLFRLLIEPRRLWRRYLVNNPIFVTLILLQLIGLRRFRFEDGGIP